MTKYPLHKDFAPLSYFKPPVCRALLPAMNTALRLMPKGLAGRSLAVKKLKLKGFGGTEIPALFMEPQGLGENAPCLLYLHGGGFALRAAGNHYALAADYAELSRCKLLLPDYRLAPRYPYPTAPEDCFCAYEWLLENTAALGIDENRIAVGGDSAGGCLAAALTLMARDRGLKPPCFQMLVYPATDASMQTESMKEFTDTPMWNAKLSEQMWLCYLKNESERGESYASPLAAATLAGLPDAYIETAEFDCLRDEGALYAKRLAEAGASVELSETKGTVHAYDTVRGSELVKMSVQRRINALKRAFI